MTTLPLINLFESSLPIASTVHDVLSGDENSLQDNISHLILHEKYKSNKKPEPLTIKQILFENSNANIKEHMKCN